MLVAEYDAFVRSTDQSVGKPDSDRWDIAIYGLVGEIGSVLSAIKKQLLGGSGEFWRLATDEIRNELGDVLWYSFSLSHIIRRLNVTFSADLKI